MRLINVSPLQLEYFIDQEHAPPYAILSHTWGEGEVSTQDFTSSDRAATAKLRGFRKIELACQQAQLDGFTHAWVDTCCIDKTSSAELTEAINSMYEWYRASPVCYAFLEDLATDDPVLEGDETQRPAAAFARSRWFTRGWTLQELIAPKTVRFYDQTWALRGTKESLAPVISVITGIEERVLRGDIDIETLPVARRMAWAAHRTTTRVEDMAYCLLGIFNVNMPMLYGERERAFIRLQEEIMRESNDTSLFAWRAAPDGQAFRGILAQSPSEFANAAGIEHSSDARFDTEFSITNKGIRMNTNLWNADGKPIFPLKCRLGSKTLAIHLHQHGAGVYARAMPELLLAGSRNEKTWKAQGITGAVAHMTPLWISKTVSYSVSASISVSHRYGIRLRHGFSFSEYLGATAGSADRPGAKTRVAWVHPSDHWDSSRELFLTRGGEDFTGEATLSGADLENALVLVGIKDGEPWVSFLDIVENGHLIPDASKSIWNLDHLGTIGSELRQTKHKDFQLEISKAVVDGEVVYCVDLTERPSQVEELASGRGGLGKKVNQVDTPIRGLERKSPF